MKRCVIIMVALCLGLAGARANLILDTNFTTPPNENTATILGAVSTELGTNVNNLLRLDNLALPPSGSLINVSYFSLANPPNGSNPNNAANISWDFTSTGAELLAVYVFGGSNGAALYAVTPDEQTSSAGVVHTLVTGNSGTFATISHILFLGTGNPGGNVPETGATVALLAAALGVIEFARRRFS